MTAKGDPMRHRGVTRRGFLGYGLVAATVGPWVFRHFRVAEAGPEEDRIVQAAKKLKPAELNGMIWSLYYGGPMNKQQEEFRKLTGIGVREIQDIPTPQIPQRAMAEAIAHSDTFDFFHIDLTMIPSLVSAGLLEPLDEYMADAGYKLEMVGNSGHFMRYNGKTYGLPTDGNVFIQLFRKDLFENPDEQKAFADKHGRPLKWPETWEEHQEIVEFFHRPDKELIGSGSLRDRVYGGYWSYMYLYSAGGFPFDDDMEPTLNTPAGQYAVDVHLNLKKASHPEAPGWGTTQMIPEHMSGHIFSSQYWVGLISSVEAPRSKTRGKWLYGLVPGSRFGGKFMVRSIAIPIVGLAINRYSPRKRQAALMALYWSTLQNSIDIVGDREFTFHDPWHPGHFTSPYVEEAYTKEGLAAVKQNLLVACPAIYLTGYLEFQEVLFKHLSEAYIGQLSAKDVLTKTEAAWRDTVKNIGKRKLKAELAGYKAAFPQIDVPS
jgi:multiple sugar transport system substrate-binding protein